MLFNKLNSISAILIAVFIFSFAASEAADQIKKIKIKTPTVQCGMCKKTIEKSLNKIDGIESVDVNYNYHIRS